MLCVDSSAIVAVVLGEANAELAASHLTANETMISAVNLVEASIVVESRQGPDAGRDLRLLIDGSGVDVVPVDEQQANRALDAWRRYGKGRHPAALNLGDCFAYALARSFDAPLLFQGNDFPQTDLRLLRLPS